MQKILLIIILLPFSNLQVYSQIIRGKVTDTVNGSPLSGASIELLNNVSPTGSITDSLGNYRIENVPIGRHQLKISYLGYESLVISELLVESGKELIMDAQLKENPAALETVVVRGTGNTQPSPLSGYSLKVEEQFRYPTTYYDPARLTMSLPGVAGVDDQGNSISVRGNSPASLRWRLEGVDIVNPNHTANAGTFSDRPTAAGGGISILSSQLLGTSHFLTGAFPAGYGNSVGGLMDMQLRNGNDQQHEYTAQVGVIGLEAAIEGPFGRKKANTNSSASYLVNYRYSFVGLLTAMGADFGNEEISFQDLSYHLNFPIKNGGTIGLFGLGGISKNFFKSPLEESAIEEDKDRFDIDFKSMMGAMGLTYNQSINNRLKVKMTAAISALEHDRTADLVFDPNPISNFSDDLIDDQKIAFSGNLSYKKNARNSWQLGVQATHEKAEFYSSNTNNFEKTSYGGEVSDWLIQTYLTRNTHILPSLKLTTGLHWSHFLYASNHTSIEPRASMTYSTSSHQQLTLAYALQSQIQQPQTYLAYILPKEGIGQTRSHQIAASFQQVFQNDLTLKVEVYNQQLFDVPVSTRSSSTFSVLNEVEPFRLSQDTLSDTGKGHNYGVDIFIEKPILTNAYFRIGSSIYRSLYTANDGVERPARFDGRYLMNGTTGKEWLKEKEGKTVIKGISTRLSWYGGFRQTPIDEAASATAGVTIYKEANANSIKLNDYYRIDCRFYRKVNKPNRSSTLSFDIQNVTNRKNEAYLYFDNYLQKVVTKKQLGLLPFLSYRVEF